MLHLVLIANTVFGFVQPFSLEEKNFRFSLGVDLFWIYIWARLGIAFYKVLRGLVQNSQTKSEDAEEVDGEQ